MPPSVCQTRVDLLDAAEELFSANGYNAVGIREIASRAGTNIASIKYHFGSKHELYLETVHRAMVRTEAGPSNGSDCLASAWDLLRDGPQSLSRHDAALLLARFIRRFLSQLLPTSGDDACGMLIIREGVQPSEAIDAVVDQYIRPNQTMLVDLLRNIKPDADDLDLARDAQCILGQIVHYRVFRAIIEKLRGHTLSQPQRLDELAAHLTQFSLRGLGCDDPFINRALAEAVTDQHPQSEPLQGNAS